MNNHFRNRINPTVPVWLLAVGLPLAVVAVGWLIASLEVASYVLIPGMLAVVAIALMGMRYERLPFYLLVASFPLLAYLRANESISVLMLIVPGGLAILAWLQHLVLHRTTIVFNLSTALAVLLGIWTILSAMNASGPTAELTGYIYRYWQGIILLFLTQNLLRKKQHFVEFGWVLAISLGLYGASIILYQAPIYLQSGASLTARQLHSRMTQFVASPNLSGMWINMGIPFVFYLMSTALVRSSRRRFYLLLLIMTLMILGTLFTVSLGAVLGLGATLAMLVLWTKNRSQRVRLILLGLIVIGAALLSPLAERFNEQFLVVAEEDPTKWGTGRGLAWYIGVQAIRQSPWLGHGPGNAGIAEVSMAYMPLDTLRRELSLGEPPLDTHNIFLGLGAELGIPALLTFLVLMASVILPLWREIRRQQERSDDSNALYIYMGQAVLIGLIVLLAHGMGFAGQLNRYLWILLGAGSAFTIVSTRDSREPASGNIYAPTRAEKIQAHLA